MRPLALSVGDDDRVPVGEERTEDPRLDVDDDSAERESARDRIRRLVVLVERVVGGLVRDRLLLVEQLARRLNDRGDVDGRGAGLAGRPVEQLRGLQQRRDAEYVVRNAASLQHRSRRDALQRRGAGVRVERIILRLQRGHSLAGRATPIGIPICWLQWCSHSFSLNRGHDVALRADPTTGTLDLR